MKVFKGIVTTILMVLGCSASASVIPYLDQAEWLSAIKGTQLVVDDFNGLESSFTANSKDNSLGYSSLSLLGGIGDPGPTGLTGSGYLEGEVDFDKSDKLSLEFNFDAVIGFSFFDLRSSSKSNPENLDLGELAIEIAGEQFSLAALVGQEKSKVPFLGFVSTSLITNFTLFHGQKLGVSPRTSEKFYLNELHFARPIQAVSEPSSLSLFFMVVIISGVFRRRLYSK